MQLPGYPRGLLEAVRSAADADERAAAEHRYAQRYRSGSGQATG